MTFQAAWDYVIILLGLFGALEQLYVLPWRYPHYRPNWFMVWLGIATFVLGVVMAGVRSMIMAPPDRQGH